MAGFRLTKIAQQDFDGIGAYTLERWGRDQAVRYLTQLDDTFTRLADDPALGRDRSSIRPGLE